MQISQEYPQFKDKKTLLVVAGAQDAKLYFAHDGSLEDKGEILVENKKYSDNEGRFETSVGGNTLYSGSAKEEPKEQVLTEFRNELGEQVHKLFMNEGVDEIYLFSPDYALNGNRDALETYEKLSIQKTISGNYIKMHPFELLKKLI